MGVSPLGGAVWQQIQAERREYERAALYDPVETLSPDQIKYRNMWAEKTKRFDEKHGSCWDDFFKKPAAIVQR